MNISIFILSYFIIISSIIGYGLLLSSFTSKNLNLKNEYSFLGAVLFIIIISYFTHFFFKHDFFHNLIVFVIGFFSFIFFIYKKKISKKNLLIIIVIFSILLISYFIAKPHDDFPYYHFPYTYYLNQNNLIIGVGNLNHGFRTPSSIFYLNSLFYLPLIKYNSFHIGSILFMGLSNLILILKLKEDYNKNKIDYIFFTTLLSFLFINIFFYRISEHGTDRSAQILIFLLFIEVLSLCRKNGGINPAITNIIILLGLIISLKAFYIMYMLIIFPIFYVIIKNRLSFVKIFISLSRNIYFFCFLLLIFLMLLTNFFNTGCFLYPVRFTCSNNFDWSLASQAQQMNNWYELWSKAGAGPNFRIDDPDMYIKHFNWVTNWFELYFFNKVSDFLLGIIFLCTVVFLTFYTERKKNIFIDKKVFSVIIVLLVLLFEWFYNHPSLRYGGYSLIALIIFIPFSIILTQFKKNEIFTKKIFILIIISILIFFGRNISRLNKEIKDYGYNLKNPYYKLIDSNFRIDSLILDAKKKYQNCNNKNINTCNYLEYYQIYEKNNYFFIKLIDK